MGDKKARLIELSYPMVVTILIIAIMMLSVRLFVGESVDLNPSWESENQTAQTDVDPVYGTILAGGMPVLASGGALEGFDIFKLVLGIFDFKDIGDPQKIVTYPMPYLKRGNRNPKNVEEVSNQLPDRNSAKRPDIDDSYYGDLPEEIKIIIKDIKPDDKPIMMPGEGPKILIYHSHSREAYKQDPENPYKELAREAFRSNDMNHTVISVGKALAGHLTALGVPTLHDATDHEGNDYNSAYSKSLETIKKRMEEYESLQMFIDVHRNSYGKDVSKNPDDEVVIINGERVAKLFVVIGTGENVEGGPEEKPNWQENAKFAMQLTNKLNEKYPGIAKNVFYRTARYNQHVSTKAILIEIGSTFTTQNEALRTTKYLAEALRELIKN
ncbi:MAG TPA: stage II sporulation protein P [Candidatus Atribacteria bacterium]|nr:stage II sporulation protein P [Candidatus Atribacteria bacterium]